MSEDNPEGEEMEALPLNEALQLSMLGSPLSSSSGLPSIIRPTASGLVWLAVPANTVGLCFRVTDGGMTLEAISWSIQDESKPQVQFSLSVDAPIVHVACSPDGRLVAAACSDGTLHCFDVTSGGITPRWTLQNAHSHVLLPPNTSIATSVSQDRSHGASAAGPIRSLQFFQDNKLLMADAQQGRLSIFQADSASPSNLVADDPALSSIHITCATCTPVSSSAFLMGDAAGTIHQASLELNKVKITDAIPFPGEEEGFACTHLECLDASPTIVAGYCRVTAEDQQDEDDPDDAADHEALLFVGTTKDGFVDLGDAVPFFTVPKYGRHVFFTTYIEPLLLVASNVGTDIVVAGVDESGQWNILDLQEGFAATTPVDEEDEYTYPVGIASVVLPDGSRALLLASTDGSLSLFELLHQINQDAFVQQVSKVPGLAGLPEMPVEHQDPDSLASPELVDELPPVTSPPAAAFGSGTPFSFGSSSVPKSLFGSTEQSKPGTSIFGQTSALGGEPSRQSKGIFGSAAPLASTPASSSASVFGSGSEIPSFGGGGGFAALASSPASGFGGPPSTKSPFSAFGSGLGAGTGPPSSMVKPLFETPKAALSPQEKEKPSKDIEPAQTADAEAGVSSSETRSRPEEEPSEKMPAAQPVASAAAVDARPGAKKAAKVFDSVDKEKTGSLPVVAIEDLLDDLGEGFHGDEYDAQAALMDPNGTGKISRSAFVDWYVQLLAGGRDSDEEASVDSAERAEEYEKAEKAFTSIAAGGDMIPVGDFGKVIDALGTVYGEKEHGKYARALSNEDGIIEKEAFLSWYVVWIFRDEEEEDEDEEAPVERVEAVAGAGGESSGGWGDTFASADAGMWKCEICLSKNPEDASACKACETPRPGHETGAAVQAPNADAGVAAAPPPAAAPAGKADGSSISSTGFHFGSAAPSSVAAPAGSSSISSIGFHFGSAAPSSVAAPAGSSSISSTGFHFGGAKPSEPTVGSARLDTKAVTSTVQAPAPTKPKSAASPPMSVTPPKTFGGKSASPRVPEAPMPATQPVASAAAVYARPGAKKAAKVFDSVDKEKTGSLPVVAIEDLLDDLGEGFHGDEYDAQAALMDPNGTGKISRSAFVDWYVQLLEGGRDSDEEASVDSAERAEEYEKAEKAFTSIAAGGDMIPVGDFGKVIDALGTVYGEKEHGKYARALSNEDGIIEKEAFLSWYVVWIFRDEEEEDEDEEAPVERVEAVAGAGGESSGGWGDTFASADAGMWKCEICLSKNPEDASACKACETPRPGHETGAAVQAPNADAGVAAAPPPAAAPAGKADGSSISSTGFHFGSAAPSSVAAPAGSSSISSIGFHFGSAAPSSVAAPAGSSSISSTGFHFGGAKPSEPTVGSARLDTKAVTSTVQAPAPTKPKSAASPPMSVTPPKTLGGKSESNFPPTSTEASKASASPALTKIKSGFPPKAAEPPKAFSGKTSAAPAVTKTKSGFPPVSAEPPKSFSEKKTAAPIISKPASKFPPFSPVAPKTFGEKKAAIPVTYPPLPSTASQTFSANSSTPAKAPAGRSPMPPDARTQDIMKMIETPSSSAKASKDERPGSLWPSDPSSEYESQFRSVLLPLLESNKTKADSPVAVSMDDEFEKNLEQLVNQREELVDSCANSRELLANFSERSLFLLSRDADIKRQVSESERLIDEQKAEKERERLLRAQALDVQSERHRRNLAVQTVQTKRLLDDLEARIDLTKALASKGDESVEKKYALFRALKADFDRTQLFESDCQRKAKTVEQLSVAMPASRPSRRGQGHTPPRSSRKMRSGGRLRALPLGVRPMARSSPNPSKESSAKKWKALESALKNADVEATGLKKVAKLSRLGSKTAPREEEAGAFLQKRGPSLLPSREAQTAASRTTIGQTGGSRLIFSSPVGRVRTSWDGDIAVDQENVRFASQPFPQTVKEISASSAARDALSSFGTTPEKLEKTMEAKKKSAASLEKMKSAPPSRLSETTKPPLTSKLSTPISGAKSSTSSVPLKKSSGFPPISKEEPKSFSSTTGSKEKTSEKTIETKTSVTPASGMVSSSSFRDMKGLGTALFSDTAKVSSPRMSPSGSMSASMSPEKNESAAASTHGSTTDYKTILTEFYQKQRPEKIADVDRHLEKYKGREPEMFAILARKYKVPNPLESSAAPAPVSQSSFTPTGQPGFASPSTGPATPFGAPPSQTLTSSVFGGLSKPPASPSPFGATTTPSSPSPFSQPSSMPSTSMLSPMPSTATSFGASSSLFGNQPKAAPTPFGNAPAPAAPAPSSLVGGRNARDVLIEFYNQKNPSKLAEVDKLLVKYQGNEAQLFVNLARRYNLDPLSTFGVSAPPTAPGPSMQPTFGSPSVLGGGPSPFGGGGFGQPSMLGSGAPAPSSSGGFGAFGAPAPSSSGGFGAFGGTSASSGATFGSLAHQSGGAAPAPFGAAGGFGSPSFGSQAPGFGGASPFGAPRR